MVALARSDLLGASRSVELASEPVRVGRRDARAEEVARMSRFRKVIVVGLDGLEPSLVRRLMDAGELPNLARLRSMGTFTTMATTLPAQTPVAFSTFATGTNPGGHGIFDFIRRDPRTYLPDLALNRYEQKNAFVPPKVVNLRRGTPLWDLLSRAGISSAILRCPCTYGPDELRGRMLSGMGVPDLRGGLGTSTFYTTAENVRPQEAENVVHLTRAAGSIRTHLIGPRNPKTRDDVRLDLSIDVPADQEQVILHSSGQPKSLVVRRGQWSEWLRVKFKLGLLQSVRGMVRFLLVRTEPHLELYASPVNFDPESPLFPISSPAEYARELAERVGLFHTTGMVEDHGGLNNGRFDEHAYLAQCDQVWRERERMLLDELARQKEGLVFCLFDTPDRVQHMFWRFGEPEHPANFGRPSPEFAQVIADTYRRGDEVLGNAMAHVDDRTLLVAMSDHGFNSFQRGVHLNTWLLDNGLLALKPGAEPGDEAGEMLRHVDWSRTKAYALGLGSVYLNLAGREASGIVTAQEAPQVEAAIRAGLESLRDPDRGTPAVRGVRTRRELYHGPYAAESPDLVVQFAAGYRVSWSAAMGGVARGHFEDNTRRWSGDHIIDPALVPGVLAMNRPFRGDAARLVDLAPTILAALGVAQGSAMEGENLLA
jgi:predicted AlkP superfamily phosphohydrolase/phosphomutase